MWPLEKIQWFRYILSEWISALYGPKHPQVVDSHHLIFYFFKLQNNDDLFVGFLIPIPEATDNLAAIIKPFQYEVGNRSNNNSAWRHKFKKLTVYK